MSTIEYIKNISVEYREGDPEKGVRRIWYSLRGPEGMVTLPFNFDNDRRGTWFGPVGSHTYIPSDEDDRQLNCDVLPGGKCFGTVAHMGGELVGKKMAESEEAFWAELQSWYRSLVLHEED